MSRAASVASRGANPRTLLLALLQAFDCAVPVQLLIRAAGLFDIDENRTRVALHRLRAKGLVHSEERGTYSIAGIRAVSSHATSWRRLLQRLRPWEGRWIGVHTAPLPRADKTVARRRDRATGMVGLRELKSGLLVRPDNLEGGVSQLRDRMIALGLEADAPVFRIEQLGPHEEEARGLWQGLELNGRYKTHTERLTRLTLRMRALAPDEAARQSFVAGGEAVRDILYDPLLPEPMVDPSLRDAFVQTMVAFDDVGRDLWARVLDTDLPIHMSPTVEP